MPVVALLAPAPPAVALVGAGDPEATRLVYAMVIGLVVVGVVLIFLGFWILRQTKPDLEVLAPLERMGDGDWKKKDTSTQRRMLDELRPDGATPLTPATRPPSIDRDFEQADHPVTSFSDLGPGVGAEQRDPTPTGAEIEVDLEPVAESDDPVAEVGLEPVAESDDPVAEVGLEPVAESDDPVAEVGLEPVAESDDPVAEVGLEPVAESDDPVAEVGLEPVAESDDPVAEVGLEPVAESDDPVAEVGLEPDEADDAVSDSLG